MIFPKNAQDVNVIHYALSKSKHVCKSVLATELCAVIDGYDTGYKTEHTLSDTIVNVLHGNVYRQSLALWIIYTFGPNSSTKAANRPGRYSTG